MRLSSLSAPAANALANDPAARGALGGTGPVDIGPVLAAGGGAWGPPDLPLAFVFAPHAPGVFSAHTVCAPGAAPYGQVLEAARLALDKAFSALPAVEVWTRCASGGQAAMARQLGFQALAGGPWWAFTWAQWASRSEAAGALGDQLHEAFEAAGVAHGPALDVGAERLHRRLSGAALMGALAAVQNGLPLLAFRSAVQYNRLAAVMGYEPVAMPVQIGLALHIDVGSGLVVSVRPDERPEAAPQWRVERSGCPSAQSSAVQALSAER